MAPKRALILNPKDTVASVLEEVQAGEEVEARAASQVVSVIALEDIPFGFKIALADISAGKPVYKYGEVIGRSSRPIGRGALVHVHNLAGARGRGDLQTGR
jgi:altronate dehydratase small subunit